MAIADGANEAKELSLRPRTTQRRSLPPSLQRPPPPRDRGATTKARTRGPLRARSGSAGRYATISSTTDGVSGGDMDYAWMEPKHDPIATDTNLAEIDFEDFRNEDLAYAFSCVSNANLKNLIPTQHFKDKSPLVVWATLYL